jgi:drug/metabolite transporter (DMT)-like permease
MQRLSPRDLDMPDTDQKMLKNSRIPWMPGRFAALDAALAGPLFMLAAALFFAMLNVCIKLLGSEFSPWDIAFYRSFGGMVLLHLIFGRHRNLYRSGSMPLLVARGCVGAVAFLAMVMAIRLLPVSTAMVIFFTYPAFAALFSVLLFGERLNRHEFFCLALVLIGAAVLFDFRLTGSLAGQGIALLGGIFAGLAMTLIQKLRRSNGSVIIYLYFCTMCALVSAPGYLLDPTFPTTWVEGGLVLAIILSSLTAQLLMNRGFFYCRGWEGGVFMSSEVIFTASVGITLLGEPASWRFWLGGLLILGSVTLLNYLRAAGSGGAACGGRAGGESGGRDAG